MTRAALHEAGHCVAAYALAIPVRAVSIDPAGGGRCELDAPFGDEPSEADLEDALVITLAGELAEAHA